MEKKLIKYVILFCATMYATTSLFAQSLSSYEQKRYDLASQTATAIIMEVPELGIMMGMSVKKTDFADKYEELYFFENLIESVGLSALYAGNGDYQSLKVKEIYRTWTEKRRAIDKYRTPADTKRENERKKKKEEALPERGTKALLIHSVKKDFEKWASKGEFEKTEELMERLRVQGPQIFDSICYLYTCGRWSVAFSTEASNYELKYDADAEIYNMDFTYGSNKNPKTIVGKASVPISFARDGRIYRNEIAVTSLRIVDRIIVLGGMSVIYHLDNNQYVANFRFDSIPGERPLSICFSEIGYTGNVPIELLSHCMNPNEYLKSMEREAFINDSINKRERFVKDSIEKRERFIRDSISQRERFVRDSITQRERFVRDSIKKRNEEIRESNYRYSKWIESYENHIERYYSYRGLAHRLIHMDGKVKKCSLEENVLTLNCGKKTYRGVFSSENVKNDIGLIYQPTNGKYEIRNVVANEDGSLVIYQYINSREQCHFVFLIVKNDNAVYEINESVQNKLKGAGLIK